MADTINVEVVHARPGKQVLLTVTVHLGATVSDAITLSGIDSEFPDLVVDSARVGIFGRKATLNEVLRAGDRVEIYRPLIADPKETRRKRAAGQ